MDYRDSAGFFCTAEMLLGLILKDGYIDLERHKLFLIFSVKDVYGTCPLTDVQRVEMVINSPYNSCDERMIIRFGKENNIPEQAWLEAIEKRTQNGL